MKLFFFALLSLGVLTQCVAPSAPTKYPLPAGFCYVDTLAPSIRVNLLYAGDDNFVGKKLAGYEGERAILRRDTAESLARAQVLFEQQGLGLYITDAYRPRRAMEDIQVWAKTPDQRMQAKYYPNHTKKEIFEHQYIGKVSEHSWGIAVDVTLINLKTGQFLDMGGFPDLLDPISATDYAGAELSEAQRANRQLLKQTMARAGFKNYSKEWWHYYLADKGKILSYDFVIDDDLQTSL
ncbi:MAG: M15 family metallopeptidase [Akkermansia sp.]